MDHTRVPASNSKCPTERRRTLTLEDILCTIKYV